MVAYKFYFQNLSGGPIATPKTKCQVLVKKIILDPIFPPFFFLTSIHPTREGSMGTNGSSKIWFLEFVWKAKSLLESNLLGSWSHFIPLKGPPLETPSLEGEIPDIHCFFSILRKMFNSSIYTSRPTLVLHCIHFFFIFHIFIN